MKGGEIWLSTVVCEARLRRVAMEAAGKESRRVDTAGRVGHAGCPDGDPRAPAQRSCQVKRKLLMPQPKGLSVHLDWPEIYWEALQFAVLKRPLYLLHD